MYGLLLVAAFAWPGMQAQPRYGTSIFIQASTPTIGSYPGSMWFDTSVDTLKIQKSDLSWATVGGAVGGLPSGAIVLVDTGACPAGTAEVAAADGRTIIGTLNANANVGTTLGSDTITPAGTNNAPALTMNSYTPQGTNTAPAISWPAGVPVYTGTVNTLAVTAHTVVATKQGTAAGNVVTTATHTITGIPGGTVAWPAGVPTHAAATFSGTGATLTGSVAAPTFTGTQFDNRSAARRYILCKAN